MLKIQTWIDNKILRNVSDDVKQEEFNKYIKLWKEMKKYIKNPDNWWVWLAAPQIWHNKRLIVVSLLRDWNDENFSTIVMINPKILEKSDDTCVDKEWCLSVPWKRWKVERPCSVKISFIDKDKKEIILHMNWLQARIVQHEIDHLDGILFVDKVVD